MEFTHKVPARNWFSSPYLTALGTSLPVVDRRVVEFGEVDETLRVVGNV